MFEPPVQCLSKYNGKYLKHKTIEILSCLGLCNSYSIFFPPVCGGNQ